MNVIYSPRKEREGHPRPEYRWVLALPLLVAPDGPSIGVVSFVEERRVRGQDSIAARIAYLASELSAEEPRAEAKELRDQLVNTVNVAFWVAVAEADDPDQELVQAILDRFLGTETQPAGDSPSELN